MQIPFKKSFLFLILSLSIATLSFSQTYTLTAIVNDSTVNLPIIGAFIKVQSVNDSTKNYTSVSNTSGRFFIANISSSYVRVKISAIGFKDYVKNIRLSEKQTDLGTLNLEINTELLAEVQVVETMQRAVQKGDTTQYNADAFKTNPDATAEDLIKKMPGVTVENGAISAQGEQVQTVLVDGKPFFGDDPKAALKNLPASAIEKIEVFDRKSDQAKFTGFDDGQEKKTINIITRPQYRNGTFGRVFAGAGTEDTYQAGGNINHFKNDQRISVVGLSNNINQQNFGNEDLLGVVGTSSNSQPRWRRGPSVDSDPNDFMVGDQGGINTTNSFGLNYTDEYGSKFKMNSSYFFNKTLNTSQQLINQQFYLTDTSSQFYNSSALGDGTNYNHRVNFRMEYKMNEKNNFIFTPNASFQSNKSSSTNDAATQDAAGLLLNSSINQYSTNLSGYNLGGDFLWQHNFDKKGRTFSTNLSGSLTNNSGNTRLLAASNFYGNNPSTDSLAQEGYPNSTRQNLRTRSNYTEPLGDKSQISFTHNYELDFNDSEKETYNFDSDSGERIGLDTNQSNVFTSQYQEHQFGLSYRYNSKTVNTGFGFEYQSSELTSDLQFPRSGKIYRSFNNILPFFMLRYQISKQKNLRMYFRGSTDEPSVQQLQDIVNNSNPLQLSVGNPNLNQAYGLRYVVRYTATNEESANNFSAYARISSTNNYITNATLIAQEDTVINNGVLLNQGSQLRYPVNLNGYWNASGAATWGLPVKVLRSNLNLQTSANYQRLPGLINQQNNLAQTLGLSQTIGLTSNISDKIDFNVSLKGDVNFVYNSLQPELNNNYYVQNTSASLSWIFREGWVVRSSVNHQWWTGLSQDFNQNFVLWNASLGKKIFKNKQGEVSISVFDLLNQNQSIARNVSENSVQDVQTLVLKQYFMFTFTYNIKAFKEG